MAQKTRLSDKSERRSRKNKKQRRYSHNSYIEQKITAQNFRNNTQVPGYTWDLLRKVRH